MNLRSVPSLSSWLFNTCWHYHNWQQGKSFFEWGANFYDHLTQPRDEPALFHYTELSELL